MGEDGREPPAHLTEGSRRFWTSIRGTWQVDDPVALELLTRLCQARDRLDQARVLLDREGLTTTDRYGQTKSHPAVTVETASRIAVSRLLRELELADPVVRHARR